MVFFSAENIAFAHKERMIFADLDYTNRLNETITHICEMCPAREQATVRQFLLDWIAQHSRMDRQQFFNVFAARGSAKGGNEQERADRRTLALINTNMLSADCPAYVDLNWIRFATATAVANKLELFPFRLFALQQRKDMSLLKGELQELLRDPELFLRTRALACQPHGIPPAGVQDYVFYFDYERQHFTISPVGIPGPAWFQSAGIRIKALNAPQLEWSDTQALHGADILLTSERAGRCIATACGVEAPQCVIGIRNKGEWDVYAQQVLPQGWHEVTLLDKAALRKESCFAAAVSAA